MFGNRIRGMLFCLLCLFVSSCSGADLVNALTPREGYRIERDVAYGSDPLQKVDLYIPEGAAASAPLLIFFHGGGWDSGSKDTYRFVGQAFASRGYVTAIADYRLYPQARWREILQDGAAVVAALADRPGTSGRPLFVIGHSAGAYIAAMVALDQRLLADAGVSPCIVRAAVGLAGPYDFLPLQEDRLKEIFGPGPAQADTQPISYVDAGDPPMLLATGDDDDTVRPRNSERLAERLRQAGVDAKLVTYPGLDHIRIVGALAAPLHFLAPVLDDSVQFLAAHSSMRGNACRSRPR